jgi:hypothetical protein
MIPENDGLAQKVSYPHHYNKTVTACDSHYHSLRISPIRPTWYQTHVVINTGHPTQGMQKSLCSVKTTGRKNARHKHVGSMTC